MEGVIDHHFRTLYSEIGGVDVCVSEFIRVNDLPTPAKTLLRECPELAFANPDNGQLSVTTGGVPLRIQLLGSNPETLASTAQTAVRLGASAIDLNFGCPAKTVNNSKGGSVLLKQPNLVNQIVAAVRSAVPRDIPVIANGEIWNVQDWLRCKEESRCNDFMMGRGLIACPDLALQIRACAAGNPHQPLQWPQVLTLLERFYKATRDAYPKRFLGNRLKQWLFYLQMHYPEAQAFFQAIKRFKQAHEFEAAFTSAPRSLRAADPDHSPIDKPHNAPDFSYRNPDAQFQRL